jgi:ubiquinone/menaquinone biosynthesis C-methylase UbiE
MGRDKLLNNWAVLAVIPVMAQIWRPLGLRPRVGSIDWNRSKWSEAASWEADGNSWTFHADTCGQPYEVWKQAVLARFLEPYLGLHLDFIEIGPGFGRWTESIVGQARSLLLVDLSPNCIDACRERFGHHPEVAFKVNDGRSLPVPDRSIDIVWSFGSFVHFDAGEVEAYLAECARVLRSGGWFIIHHSGWPEWSLPTAPLLMRLGRPGRVLQHRLAQKRWRPGGDRAPMSEKWFSSIASRHGLRVEEQIRTWGQGHQFGLAFNDVISIGSQCPEGRRAAQR